MKVLHVLDHSLPHHSGYAFRSQSILQALRARGVQTAQLTGPKHVHDGDTRECFSGLEYRRCPDVVSGTDPWSQWRCVRVLRSTLEKALDQERPDLNHCHSPSLNGLAALRLGYRVVYEVRASWEDAAASSGMTHARSARYSLSRALETFVARQASALVVICEGLRREFLARGIAPEKVTVVGNAADPCSFGTPDAAATEAFRRRVGAQGRRTIGFFGSFYDYEGLETLIEALSRVCAEVPDALVLLAGGGETEPHLRVAVERLGLRDAVRFLGRVPHEDIATCYAAYDVMAFARLSGRLWSHMAELYESLFLEARSGQGTRLANGRDAS